MSSVGVFQAKNKFSELLDRVEHGEEITITRNGKPVAKLVATAGRDIAKARAAADWIRANRSKNSLGGLKIKDLINEGRKY
jgi:prevent-host-death family protein